MWRIVAVDSVTRKVFYDLTNVATASWSSKLNGAGDVTVTVQVRDAITPVPVEVLELLRRRQKATTIVVGWVQSNGTTFAMSDALIDQSVWHPDTGVLELSGQSVWALMGERMIYPLWARDLLAIDDAFILTTSTIEYATWWLINASVGSGQQIVRLSDGEVLYTPTGTPNRHLRFYSDLVSQTKSEQWEFPFKARTALEILQEYLGYDGAPDVAIQPRIIDEEIWYLASIGTDLSKWEIELVHERASGFQSRVTGLQVVKDGIKGTTSLLKVGGGSGKSMQSRVARPQDIGETVDGLTRERITSAKQADDATRLQRLAIAELRTYQHDVEQWSFNVQCDDALPPTWFMPGVTVRLQYGGDELYPAREQLFQLLGVSGSTDSMQLSLEIQDA